MDVVEATRKMNDKYGFVNQKILKSEYGISDWQIYKMGGVKKLCRQLNIKHMDGHRPNPKDIKEDVLRIYNENGGVTVESYLVCGKYSKQAIRTAFGSFNSLLNELGIKLNMVKNPTIEEVKKDMLLYVESGKLSSQKYRKCGKYSQSTIERLFGSWSNAVKNIGLKPLSFKVGKHEMLKKLKSLYEEYGFLSKTLVEDNCDFTYQAAKHAFGGKKKISEALGIEDAFKKKGSTGAVLVRDYLKRKYGNDNVIEEFTSDWLLNTNTGHHLYADFVVESYRLCVEYDGEQHTKYSPYFYKTQENFEKAKKRDEIKEKLMTKNGYRVIRIGHLDLLTDEILDLFINIDS